MKSKYFLGKAMECFGWWLRTVNRREVRAQITCDICGGVDIVHALVMDDRELNSAIRKKGWWVSLSGRSHKCHLCSVDNLLE